MSEANFIYNGNQTVILCQEKDSVKEVFLKFKNKVNIENKEVIYLYNGNKINDENKTIEQIFHTKSFNILVYDADNIPINTNFIKYSKEVICPECKCSALLNIKDYKFNIICNNNNHIFNNILIKDYKKTQEIDNNKIICNFCNNNNKSNTYKNSFYRCNMCNKDICPKCKINHEHKIIDYDEKNYICNKHNELYIFYCKTCKKNICMICENNHDKHELITYGKIIIEDDKIIEGKKEIRKEINEFEDKINNIIKELEIIKENIEEYYKIINDIIDNYINNKKRNYEILKNIKEIIYNNNIINDIKKINNDFNYNNIIDIYNKINKIKDNDIIIYKINNNEDKIKIFGKDFVKNNKNKIKLEIEDKEYELMEYYKINNNNKNELEVKIKGIENVTNMSYMFYECSSLINLPDISKWNTTNVIDMSGMFYGCSSSLKIPDKFK